MAIATVPFYKWGVSLIKSTKCSVNDLRGEKLGFAKFSEIISLQIWIRIWELTVIEENNLVPRNVLKFLYQIILGLLGIHFKDENNFSNNPNISFREG